MKKLDIILAIVTGEVAAWFFYGILKTLEFDLGILVWVLFILFPFLAFFCLWLAYLIGKKFLFVFQLAKFVLVGVLATIVDLGTFSGLILISGVATGLYASVFKGITFIAATSSKYFLDKFWAFEKMEKTGMGKEFSQFFIVTLIGFAVNVGLFSFVNDTIGSQFGMNEMAWANLAAIFAAIITAAWNFLGYKFIVFKK